MDTKELAKVSARALFYASMQASWGSVEMSSKFSVLNFSKDQKTLQNAANALKSYICIGTIWTGATMLTLYSTHGITGMWLGFIANLIMMVWIIISYVRAFKSAARENKLQEPLLFDKKEKLIAYVSLVVLMAWMMMHTDINL